MIIRRLKKVPGTHVDDWDEIESYTMSYNVLPHLKKSFFSEVEKSDMIEVVSDELTEQFTVEEYKKYLNDVYTIYHEADTARRILDNHDGD